MSARGESVKKRSRAKAKRHQRDVAETQPRARLVFQRGRWIVLDELEDERR
jgi:hypothetical protein